MTDLELYPIFVDFETRSKANLKVVGGRAYAAHPSTSVLCAVFLHPEHGRIDFRCDRHATDQDPRLSFLTAAELDRPVVAHNATSFDRHVWNRLNWPKPSRWIDTAELARRGGLPRADLDWCLKHFLGREKDMAGNKLTLSLSRVRPKDTKAGAKRGEFMTPIVDTATLDRVVEYCWSDVEGLAQIWPHLSCWDRMGFEDEVLDVDHVINDRGFLFDVELAQVLLDFDEWLAEQACADAGVDAATVRAPLKLAQAFLDLGVPIPNAQRDTIEPLMTWEADDGIAATVGLGVAELTRRVRALAKARLATSSICGGKLEAGLARVSADSRLRDLVAYFAAHTGRWGGRALQPHNLPKPGKKDVLPRVQALGEKPDRSSVETAIEADIRALIVGDHHPSLGTNHVPVLLRACITAPPGYVLAVADYSAVEARGLAWAAEDQAALVGFRTPGYDPYRAIAGRLFSLDPASIPKDDWRRQVGKIAELGLGYGMGGHRSRSRPDVPSKFEQLLIDSGVDLERLESEYGLTPGSICDTWREVHAPIVRFWAESQAAAIEAVNGRPTDVGPFRWARVDQDVWCLLPSGRPIVYHRMHTVRGAYGPELSYHSRKGLEYTYGGKLTENLIQALCREILARALVLVEREGLRPVLHVHDEIVCEVPEDQADDALALLETVMTDVPDWAEGFPLGAEGFVAKRYRK